MLFRSQADVAAAGFGWRVEVVDDRRDGVAAGKVLDQDPAAGVRLAEGGVLRLVRSLGNTLVVVPDLAGKPFDDPGVRAAFSDVSLLIDRVDRLDETVPGTGLGLAIVKHILETHHTRAEVKSEPGKGSEFSFRLPRLKQKD